MPTPAIPATKTLQDCIRQNYVVLRGRDSSVAQDYFDYCKRERKIFLQILPRNKYCTMCEPEMSGAEIYLDLIGINELKALKAKCGFSSDDVPAERLDWFAKEIYRITSDSCSRAK